MIPEVIPVTADQVLAFVAVTMVPAVVDVLRVGTFQIAMRFEWKWLADLTATSRFGIAITMFTSLVAGLFLSIWLGSVEPTVESIGANSLMILGWANVLYKLGYEKSDTRKTLVTQLDRIGPESDQTHDVSEQLGEPIENQESVG